MLDTLLHDAVFRTGPAVLPDDLGIPPLLIQVVIAVAMGGLIGLERERSPTRKFAGLRTMALLCGAGPIVVSIPTQLESRVLLALMVGLYLALALGLALTIAYIRFSLHGSDVGLTTSVTVFLVALLGVLVGLERFVEASTITILTVVLLSERERLHGYVEGLTDQELRDSLKLGALVFVLFPILPTEPVDPFGVVVLREVLLFVIFVLLIEFSAYVLMRLLGGSTGLALTGLLAGGANSLAAAGVLSKMAERNEAALDAASVALLLATVSMIVRNVGIAVVLAVPLFWLLWQPTGLLVALTLGAAGLVWYRGTMGDAFDIDVDSPFSFGAAAKFAIAYVTILVVSVGAESLLGALGLFATAFAGGLVSSAAVSITAATVYQNGGVAAGSAVVMVLLGIVASLVAKMALVEWTSDAMRRRVVLPMAVVASAGLGLVVVL